MSCKPFDNPHFVPGWICCECTNTLNGNNRDTCKLCGHKRCGAPDAVKVPVLVEDGMVIVPIKSEPIDPKKVN